MKENKETVKKSWGNEVNLGTMGLWVGRLRGISMAGRDEMFRKV
jgi:hypothetical protein